MPDERRHRDGDYTRSESEAERLDRNFGELLQELRVAQAGIQILFGFLLSLAFQSRFEALDTLQLGIYLVTLVAAALAVICFTGPVAAHRLLFRRGVKDFLVRYTARLAGVGLGFLAVTALGGVVLVVDVLLGHGASFGTGGALVAILTAIWLLVPWSVRHRGHEPDEQ